MPTGPWKKPKAKDTEKEHETGRNEKGRVRARGKEDGQKRRRGGGV